jgi:hypothetical protein
MSFDPDTAARVARCGQCGYGISIVFEPDCCPMCEADSPWVEDGRGTSLAARGAWTDVDVHASERFRRKGDAPQSVSGNDGR